MPTGCDETSRDNESHSAQGVTLLKSAPTPTRGW